MAELVILDTSPNNKSSLDFLLENFMGQFGTQDPFPDESEEVGMSLCGDFFSDFPNTSNFEIRL